MPNINHQDIADPNIHEPKGAASAAADAIYVADGAGSGTWKKRIFEQTAALTPAAINQGSSSTQAFTVAGVAATDLLMFMSLPGATTGFALPNDSAGNSCVVTRWYVSAVNTITIVYSNGDVDAAHTPTAGTYTFIFFRP